MKRILATVLLLVCTIVSSPANSEEIQKHSTIPKEVYYKFIKEVRPHIPTYEMEDIFRAIEYYTPRYFGEKGVFEESLTWTLSSIARESVFDNINGDEGKSIGYMMVQIPTCDIARKHNGIKRELNLIARWDNIHCGMAEMNRLYEHFAIKGDWEKVLIGYNGGTGVVMYPQKYRKGDRMTKVHLKAVKKYRKRLLEIIEEYELSLTRELGI